MVGADITTDTPSHLYLHQIQNGPHGSKLPRNPIHSTHSSNQATLGPWLLRWPHGGCPSGTLQHLHTLRFYGHLQAVATSSPIRQAASLSHPTAAMHKMLSSRFLMPTWYNPFPSRIAPKKNFFVQIARSTPGSHYADSNLSCTNLTMKHQKCWNVFHHWRNSHPIHSAQLSKLEPYLWVK